MEALYLYHATNVPQDDYAPFTNYKVWYMGLKVEGLTPPPPFNVAVFVHTRHHTNPVGTEWRWKTDNADDILREALENHYQMIKQFRGTHCWGCVCVCVCVAMWVFS